MEEYFLVKEFLESTITEDSIILDQYLQPLVSCYERYLYNNLTENAVNMHFNTIPYFNCTVNYMPPGVEEKINQMYQLFMAKAKEQSNV